MPIFMTTKREFEIIDLTKVRDSRQEERTKKLPIGRHEMERITNPFTGVGSWLIVKGTTWGAAEGSWRQWENHFRPDDSLWDWGDFQVIIEETLPDGAAISRYTKGSRPRCSVCDHELEPASTKNDRYSGFHPCLQHESAPLIYPAIPA